MLDFFLLFISQLATVLLLGVNGKLNRDDKWKATMVISWGIAAAQLCFVYVIKITDLAVWEMFIASGAGGSLGIGLSHLVYVTFWNNKGG